MVIVLLDRDFWAPYSQDDDVIWAPSSLDDDVIWTSSEVQ